MTSHGQRNPEGQSLLSKQTVPDDTPVVQNGVDVQTLFSNRWTHWQPWPQQLLPQAALTHEATVPRQVLVEGLAHAVPAAQQAAPHGVWPAGHPHVPVERLVQAMPAWQQHGPHGVVPAPQGAFVGPLHAACAGEARKAASALVAAAPNASPRARRRESGAAIARVRSSKVWPLITAPPGLGPPS